MNKEEALQKAWDITSALLTTGTLKINADKQGADDFVDFTLQLGKRLNLLPEFDWNYPPQKKSN